MDKHFLLIFLMNLGFFKLILENLCLHKQEVSHRNHKISMLELEKDALLEQLDELQVF